MPLKMCGSVKRALQRVIVGDQPRGKRRQVGIEHLEPAAIVFVERRFTSHQMHDGLPLRSGLGQQQRSGGEVEGEQTDLAGNRRAPLPPAQPAGNHQMDDEEQRAVELEDQPLAQPAECSHRAAGNAVIGGS